MYGIRPSCYLNGRPGYTLEKTLRPEFKIKLPVEPSAIQNAWRSQTKRSPAAAPILRGDKHTPPPAKPMDVRMIGFPDYPPPASSCASNLTVPPGS